MPTTQEPNVPLFGLEKLFELRVDPWDEVVERRRDAVAAATAASSGASSASLGVAAMRRASTIVTSAFKKVGDASILAVVVESNSILLRTWLSDGKDHKVECVIGGFFLFLRSCNDGPLVILSTPVRFEIECHNCHIMRHLQTTETSRAPSYMFLYR